MNVIASLKASAEAYLICGEESAAALCHRMARECEVMDREFAPGAGDALHRHYASQLAERAALKLHAYNQRRAA